MDFVLMGLCTYGDGGFYYSPCKNKPRPNSFKAKVSYGHGEKEFDTWLIKLETLEEFLDFVNSNGIYLSGCSFWMGNIQLNSIGLPDAS
jgi:hypothetical protein